jgi:hypothetical protein
VTLGLAHLLETKPPWIVCLLASVSGRDVEDLMAEAGVSARVLNATQMSTTAGLMDEFAARLGFPPDFGRNWNALADCLTDLQWFPGFAYALVIENSHRLLISEPPPELALFSRVIIGVATEWAEPIDLGEDWDRSAIPFHLLIHDSQEYVDALHARFQVAGVMLEELELGDA